MSRDGENKKIKETNPDGLDNFRKLYLNKWVQLFPGDSYPKFGEIIDVCAPGVSIKITKSEAKEYEVDSIHFIPFSRLFICLI